MTETPRKPFPSALWRAGLVGLLLLALWDPAVPLGTPPIDLIVVLDESRSMAETGGGTAWPLVTGAATGLPSDSRLALLRYGAAPRIETVQRPLDDEAMRAALAKRSPPARLAVDDTATDSERALRAALRLVDGERGTVVLLASDGKDTAGDAGAALGLARDAGIPVYWLDAGSPAPEGDSWIEAVSVPGQALAGRRIPVDVTLGGTVETPARLIVRSGERTLAETALRLSGHRPASARLWLEPQTPGLLPIEVVLRAEEDARPQNNRRQVLVRVEGRSPLLFVSRQDRASPLAGSLEAGGWSVARVRPSQFPLGAETLRDFAAIVLEDVGVSDMPDAAWDALEQAVRGAGTGLVVLGGPRSFAAGAYYKSRLEGLLPVTAETTEPKGRVAVLFVVDKSGSMERRQHDVTRFDYARLAVTETAASLGRDDLLGLVWFDAEPREAMSLEAHPDPRRAIEDAWRITPAGGTVLAPALGLAVERLRAAPAKQRLLVLVTDGFLSGDEDHGILRREMAEAGIEVVAVVIGGNRQIGALRSVLPEGGGRILRVDDVAELPRLIRAEVELWRNPAHLEPAIPRQARPLPFLAGGDRAWPRLEAYMVTKARPAAFVYLASDRGDPLLAMHHVGAARVVALPAGLGPWADAWARWPSWGAFAGGLADWVSARSTNPNLHARIENRSDGLEITVDALGPGSDWATATDAEATILAPNGDIQRLVLEARAPGRFQGHAEAAGPGLYRASLRVGDQTLRRAVLRGVDQELFPDPPASSTFADLARDGLLRVWTPASDLTAGLEGEPGSLRAALLAAAAVLYLLGLIFERIGWSLAALGRRLTAGPPDDASVVAS